MYFLKKRIPRGTIMLCLCALLIAVCACLMLGNLYQKDLLYKDARGYYSQYSHQLSAKKDATPNALEKALADDVSEGVLFYKIGLESLYDTRGVFTKSQSDTPPLRRGRFFTPDDYVGQKRIAVVGSFFEKDIFPMDGREMIALLGENFEVVGILGRPETSRLDTMTWIPLDTAIELTGIDGDYAIDGASARDVERDLTALQGLMRLRLDSYNGELRESALAMLTDAPDAVTYVYLAALLSFLLSIIFVSAYWISYRQTEAYVKRMNGYGNLSLLLSLLGRYLSAVLPAAVLGSALAFALQRLAYGGSALWIHLLLGTAIAVFPGLLIVVLQIVQLVLTREIKPARGTL